STLTTCRTRPARGRSRPRFPTRWASADITPRSSSAPHSAGIGAARTSPVPKPLERPPEEWKSAGEPMTDSQASFLKRLSTDAGQEFDATLSKAAASRRIDELLNRDKGDSSRSAPARRSRKPATARPAKAKATGGTSDAP